MNKAQQTTSAIIIPIIFLVIGYGIITTLKIENLNYSKRFSSIYTERYIGVKWDNFQETWWIWLTVFIAIGVFEYLLFNKTHKK